MSDKTIVVGLDIGTTKIACFVGVKDEFDKIEIITMGQCESLGVSRGEVTNIDKTVDAIGKVIAEAKSKIEGNLDIRSVYVGIAGQHIRSSQHRGMLVRKNIDEQVSQKDVDRLIEDMMLLAMNPGEEIIHVLPQEYIIDDMPGVLNPIGSPGTKIEANFHIIIGNTKAGKNIDRCLDISGLKTEDMILEPLASSASVLTQEEKEGGVALVDIGGGTTDVAIFANGVIRHTAVIPFGGNIISEDIKKGCNILIKQAEQLKVQFGKAIVGETKGQRNEVVCIPGFRGRSSKEISVNNLAEIIQARLEEILELVNMEIHKSGYADQLIAGIVLTGGGAQMKHIAQLCEYITGIDTRIGFPTEHLSAKNEDSMKSPMYSTGIGLVLEGFNKKQSDNAKNRIVKEQEKVVEDKWDEGDGDKDKELTKERTKVIKGHSKGLLKGGFYDKILGMKDSLKGIFDYEENEE